MAAKQKFPYTMHCPGCKIGIKIKSPQLVGQRINCPKCKKRIDVVTEEEDGYVSYGVAAAPEPEPEPEPTEEELLEAERQEKLERRKVTIARTKYIISILWLLLLLGGIGYVFYWALFIKGIGEEKDGHGE